MKKVLFSVIIVLIGLLFLKIDVTPSAYAEQDDPTRVPTECETKLPLNSKPPDGWQLRTTPVTPDMQQDIIVLLSENIEGRPAVNPENYLSCSEIIECLRAIYSDKGADGNRDTKFYEVAVGMDLEEFFPFCVVKGADGLELLNNYASIIYKWIAGLVGAVCILIIIFSGIQISMGGLSQEEISGSKDRITRSLVGLAVLFLSAFILYTINPTFFT